MEWVFDHCPHALTKSLTNMFITKLTAFQVSGIVGRADLLCALFVFVAFLSYVRAVRQSSEEIFIRNQTCHRYDSIFCNLSSNLGKQGDKTFKHKDKGDVGCFILHEWQENLFIIFLDR